MGGPLVIILTLFAFFVIILAAKGIKVVRHAQTMVIERLGKFSRVLEPGINIIWPIIDQPRKSNSKVVKEGYDGRRMVVWKSEAYIDLREVVYDFPRQNVITRDNVVIEINALLYFQITDPKKSVYEIVNLPDAIEKLTQTTLRNVIGELDLDQTLASRDTINTKLRTILDEATDKWGVKVNRVELQDINPPADIKNAMEKQMRAERDKRATTLEADGTREAAVTEAEGEKKAAILRAEGQAVARVKVAHAEAEAIRKISEVINQSGGSPTNYLIAIKYIETLKEMVSGQSNKVIYLPYEATGILSSIGGIKDMFESKVKNLSSDN